nr:hypothetical protein [Tanacetum cinerariifolium]
VMDVPTILVSVNSFEGNFRDTIDIGVDVIHLEELMALRNIVDIIEAENAYLLATIRTMKAFETITRNYERLACIEIER